MPHFHILKTSKLCPVGSSTSSQDGLMGRFDLLSNSWQTTVFLTGRTELRCLREVKPAKESQFLPEPEHQRVGVGRGCAGEQGKVVSLNWGDRAEQEEDVQRKGSINLHSALPEPWDEFSAMCVNLGKEQLHSGAAAHCQRISCMHPALLDPPEQRDRTERGDLVRGPVGAHLCCRINLPERKCYPTPT